MHACISFYKCTGVYLYLLSVSSSQGNSFKPVSADIRRLQRYKYLIYLWGRSWSSSIKRLLISGSVVFLPAENPHESFVTSRLAGCSGCFLKYDYNAICASVLEQKIKTNDTVAQQLATRANSFMKTAFSMASVLAYMADTLRALTTSSMGVPFPNGTHTNYGSNGGADELHIDGKILQRVTCMGLKHDHRKLLVNQSIAWQIDEWFDDLCDFKSGR